METDEQKYLRYSILLENSFNKLGYTTKRIKLELVNDCYAFNVDIYGITYTIYPSKDKYQHFVAFSDIYDKGITMKGITGFLNYIDS